MAINRSSMNKQVSVGRKIKKLKKEKIPHKQAIAIALNMKKGKRKK